MPDGYFENICDSNLKAEYYLQTYQLNDAIKQFKKEFKTTIE